MWHKDALRPTSTSAGAASNEPPHYGVAEVGLFSATPFQSFLCCLSEGKQRVSADHQHLAWGCAGPSPGQLWSSRFCGCSFLEQPVWCILPNLSISRKESRPRLCAEKPSLDLVTAVTKSLRVNFPWSLLLPNPRAAPLALTWLACVYFHLPLFPASLSLHLQTWQLA